MTTKTKLFFMLFFTLTFLGITSVSEAYYYYYRGYHGGRVYYYTPAYHRYYSAPQYYYRPAGCRWVPGHWAYGYWYPASRVCW